MKKISEFEIFDAAVRQILSVSHDELKRREEEWKLEHPNKRKKRATRKETNDKRD
jgi:hypothetical protein